MIKKSTKQNINEMKQMTRKMPKTITETINFDGQLEEEEYDDYEEPSQEEMDPRDQMPANNSSQNAKQLIDNIRKMALKAMAELADNPEDENYIILKKVWSMTDRKPEQDKNNMQKSY